MQLSRAALNTGKGDYMFESLIFICNLNLLYILTLISSLQGRSHNRFIDQEPVAPKSEVKCPIAGRPRCTPRSASLLHRCGSPGATLPHPGRATAMLPFLPEAPFTPLLHSRESSRVCGQLWEELKGQTGDKHVSATDRGQEVAAGFGGMERRRNL